ncbi:MAG: hypothetical protein HOE62_21655 [Alphaproteobacteria bacterium]|nr:hypothetical protein [Alphaproteobacteria bacterium]MBT4020572.1 hypothetical protein [Alphaproteobacteria bacterium]MBT4964887.1 hypothetical protein [Alphaproteobacteria bacterium]MBT5918613.1 hypothetical protein [Alphaproteobacteria bacterium]MBT6387660.1 hypothetical protein [Alphaproteobacteria bacterium]
MREMIASKSFGPAGITALVPCIALLCIALLTGCTKFSDLQSPLSLRKPDQLATSEIPVVNWSDVREVHMLATEFAFSPNDPVFKAGVPYRLFIRNVGDNEHVLRGAHFLRAIAVHQVKLTEFTSHGNDGHVDKAIGPDNADGVPEIPPVKQGARDLVAENNAEAIAEAQAGKPGQEAADPFAAKGADEDADEEAEDGDEGAANPFAAKDEGETEEDAEEAANPFSAKPEGETETDEANTGQASTEENGDDQASDEEMVAAKIEDDGIENDDDAKDDDIGEAIKTPAEEADDDDDVVAAKPASPAKPAVKEEIDWQPLDISRIAIPVGREVSIEFVAVRPGTYRIHSADLKYAMTGMFGEAKIE